MSRLTQKINHKDLYTSTQAHITLCQKLGHLEDLEERIGCPLEVVFEALEKGIYTNEMVSLGSRESKSEIANVELAWYRGFNSWVLVDYDLCVQLKDYKRTWWLEESKER